LTSLRFSVILSSRVIVAKVYHKYHGKSRVNSQQEKWADMSKQIDKETFDRVKAILADPIPGVKI